MLVTPNGIIILVRPLQNKNAYASMLVTLFGIVYDVLVFLIGYFIKVVIDLLNNTPKLSLLKYVFEASTYIFVKLLLS